jgi:predicted MFS family arabinose efflux permease
MQLAINAASMVLYGVATNEYVILASRFLVGCANGIQWGLLDLASAYMEHRSRTDVLLSVRMGAYTLAFILGMGMAGVSVWHRLCKVITSEVFFSVHVDMPFDPET